MITAALLLGLVPLALAEDYAFAPIYASLSLPEGVYKTVLTPENLAQHEAFIQEKGGTVASWQADFAARGILLAAYDPDNSRVLVLSALADVDGQQIFDVNEHSSDVRAKYRIAHGPNGAYRVLGYNYDSVSWKNFAKIGRFLQLRYSYRIDGEVERRGFQRRTVRNGYTITMDMQVFGRQTTEKDNAALNKVFGTFAFTQILKVPPLPLGLDETTTAPVETGKASFTMKGKTKPEASLRAVLISFGTSATKVYEAKANKAGAYSLPIDLPGEDVYVMTLTVSAAGFEDFSKSYNIRYQQGLIPVQMISTPPLEISQDQLVLAGQTTEGGVKAVLTVNGQQTTKNLPKNGSFSFDIDTKAEGSYDIRLVLSKKGLQDRVFQYNPVRVLSPQAREEVLQKSALHPSYAELIANPNSYDGKLLQFEGTLIEKTDLSDTWVLKVALKKTETGFEEVLMITSESDPGLALNTQVKVFGQMVGMNIGQDEQGQEQSLPKLSLHLIKAQ